MSADPYFEDDEDNGPEAGADWTAKHLAAARHRLGPRINRIIRSGSDINEGVAMARARELFEESGLTYYPPEDEETESQ